MAGCSTGPTWTATSFDGSNLDTQSFAVYNNLYIVGGQNNTNGGVVIQYSSDGTNWTRVEVGYAGGGGVKSFASGNGILIGIVNFDKHITSTDGINWTIVSHWPPVSGEQAFAFGAGNFVITINGGDAFAYSPTGAPGTWTITNCAAGSKSYMDYNRVYGDGLFVSVGQQGFGVTPSVTTPITAINYPGGSGAGAIAYGNGVYLAIGGSDAYRSTDGYNWTYISNAFPESLSWDDIIFAQDHFLMCRRYDNRLAYSSDGLNWSLTSGDSLFNSASNVGQTIIATDENGKYLAGNPFNSNAQIGLCIPVIEYSMRLSNVSMRLSNVRINLSS